MLKVSYISAIGSIMYSMVCCKPNLSYSMSVVRKFMANLGKRHWKATKWVLKYISRTTDVRLKYVNHGEVPMIERYVDSDFARSINSRKSIVGYVFKVFQNIGSWHANLQSVVAFSTTEAKYMSASKVVKEPLWLKGLVLECNDPPRRYDITTLNRKNFNF